MLSKDLVYVIGTPDIMSVDTDILYQRAKIVLNELNKLILCIPTLPETDVNAFYPLDAFYHTEFTALRQKIDTILKDAEILHAAVQGRVPTTTDILDMIERLCAQRIPSHWLLHDEKQPPYSVVDWMQVLQTKATHLVEYFSANSSGKFIIYQLAMFMNAANFMQSLLLHYARKEFQDFHSFSWDIEVIFIKQCVAQVTKLVFCLFLNLLVYCSPIFQADA